MFSGVSKVGADLAGTADNCKIIDPQEFNADPQFAFVLPHETPYVVLKSLKTTNIFTDKAYIRISGGSAAGTKREIKRFDWAKTELNSVCFETAGMSATDQDCELNFCVGNSFFSIDISKEYQNDAIKIYRTLASLCMHQQRNVRYLSFAKTLPAIHINLPDGSDPSAVLSSTVSSFIEQCVSKYDPESYKGVFEENLRG
jgi:hypothetical protein